MTLPNNAGSVKMQNKSRTGTMPYPAESVWSGGHMPSDLLTLIAFFEQRTVNKATENTANNRHHPEQPQLF